MRQFLSGILLLLLCGMTLLIPQETQVLTLANDRVEFTVRVQGGAFAGMILRNGPEKLNPLAAMGHFLCLDGFGAPSDEEKNGGMPFHGEASKQKWSAGAERTEGKTRLVTLSCSLPLAQESFSRTLEIVEGENIVYVENELESLIGVDRPVSWAEHATLGPPFLEKGSVVVDMPADQCRVRAEKPGPIPGRLVFLKDFRWPLAPTRDGGQADLRSVPEQNYLDLASCRMEPGRKLGYVTAIQLKRHLLFGYVFRREEYPWLMSWMNYTGNERAARGMEFSTQPFDVSHRETVDASPMFGTPTFRWLPAKSKIRSRFLVFYTQAPDGFTKVDEVTLEGGVLKIEDRKSGKTITLSASRPL
jgi:hypothetical protein